MSKTCWTVLVFFRQYRSAKATPPLPLKNGFAGKSSGLYWHAPPPCACVPAAKTGLRPPPNVLVCVNRPNVIRAPSRPCLVMPVTLYTGPGPSATAPGTSNKGRSEYATDCQRVGSVTSGMPTVGRRWYALGAGPAVAKGLNGCVRRESEWQWTTRTRRAPPRCS